MILQQKDKSNKFIYIYIIFFILITSINNKNFYDKELLTNKLIFEINGLSFNDNQKLIKDLTNKNKDNIFKLDKNKFSNIINENNLVLNFLAKKNYPNKIKITINKANYVGKLYKNEKFSLILSNGKLIDRDVNKMKDLPFFYGNFKSEDFLNFLNILNTTRLETKNVSSFYFFPSGRWDIKFKNGLLLKLPIKDVKNTLSKFLILKNNQNFKNLKLLDLRIKNRIVSNGW